MENRSAAGAGVALTGLVFVAAALAWKADGIGLDETAVLAALGAVAFGAFTLRRHDRLDRIPASLVAGAASLGVVGYVGVATVGALAGGTPTFAPWATTLALVGGFGGVVAAYGDGRGLPQSLGRTVKAVGWGLTLGFTGLFTMAAWAAVLSSLTAGVVSGQPSTTERIVIGAVALGLGTGTVALVYFRLTGKTLSSLDVRVPTKHGVGYFLGGVAGVFALQLLVSFALKQLGTGTASHSVQQAAASGDASVLLLLIPASWLIIGPGEELLYRNIMQKSLYEPFGEWGAVAVSSGVFALAHIPAYAAGATPVTLFNTLAVIFLLSLVLGTAYLRTENLTVSIAIHGTYDAIVFAAMYVRMTGVA